MSSRSNLACVLVLVCAGILRVSAAAPGEEAWHQVATIDATQPAPAGFVISGTAYRYTVGEIPAGVLKPEDARRSVLYASRLDFGFGGLNPQAKYQVRATFLSDSADRELEIRAGNTVWEPRLALPLQSVLARNWEVPATEFTNGNLRVSVAALAGANAVISSLAVWSTDATPLRGPPPLADRLARMTVPLPRLSPLPEGDNLPRTPR
jgi:hypothetical protein